MSTKAKWLDDLLWFETCSIFVFSALHDWFLSQTIRFNDDVLFAFGTHQKILIISLTFLYQKKYTCDLRKVFTFVCWNEIDCYHGIFRKDQLDMRERKDIGEAKINSQQKEKDDSRWGRIDSGRFSICLNDVRFANFVLYHVMKTF